MPVFNVKMLYLMLHFPFKLLSPPLIPQVMLITERLLMRVLVMKGHILNFIYLLFQGFFFGGGGGSGSGVDEDSCNCILAQPCLTYIANTSH